MRLSELGEFRLIRSIKAFSGKGSRDIVLGIGDDAAAIRSRADKTTLLTSDMLIEGVHFHLSYTSFRQLGHKALAVNISDIFAMGGRPRHFLLDLGIPGHFRSGNIRDLYRGIRALASQFDITVIGGDTCSSGNDLILAGTLTGETARPISRGGARPGDYIYVNGTPGDSAMGLKVLRMTGGIPTGKRRKKLRVAGAMLDYKAVRQLIKRHLTPEPVPLKRTGVVTSMIDISDGLLADLGHLCEESGVGAEVYSADVPLSRPLHDTCSRLGVDPLDPALRGGEDYLLLFTSPSKTRKDACRIGRVIERGRFLIDPEGRRSRFRAGGYEHFK